MAIPILLSKIFNCYIIPISILFVLFCFVCNLCLAFLYSFMYHFILYTHVKLFLYIMWNKVNLNLNSQLPWSHSTFNPGPSPAKMAESGVSYREVVQFPRYQNKWRDIIINTGEILLYEIWLCYIIWYQLHTALAVTQKTNCTCRAVCENGLFAKYQLSDGSLLVSFPWSTKMNSLKIIYDIFVWSVWLARPTSVQLVFGDRPNKISKITHHQLYLSVYCPKIGHPWP
jgi:hypothetical protein